MPDPPMMIVWPRIPADAVAYSSLEFHRVYGPRYYYSIGYEWAGALLALYHYLA